MANKKQPKLAACPHCGSGSLSMSNYHKPFYVFCDDCDADGPKERTEAKAIAAWNRRFVTLDKNGKPVFAGDKVKTKFYRGKVELLPTIRPINDDGSGDYDARVLIGEIELIEKDGGK